MLLILNKVDLVEEIIESGSEVPDFMTSEYMQKFADDYGFMGAMATSAKTGQGVSEAVAALVKDILVKELTQGGDTGPNGTMNDPSGMDYEYAQQQIHSRKQTNGFQLKKKESSKDKNRKRKCKC